MEDAPDPYADIYNPWHDPALIDRAAGDQTLLDLLATSVQARINMESVFADEGATEEDKRAARERLTEVQHNLDDYRGAQRGGTQ